MNRILQEDRLFFFLIGFVRIGLVLRSQHHPIRHDKSTIWISQAASKVNHCPGKADQYTNKARREVMHKESASSDTDTGSNKGPKKGSVVHCRHSTHSIKES